jgi:hypothetical protein
MANLAVAQGGQSKPGCWMTTVLAISAICNPKRKGRMLVAWPFIPLTTDNPTAGDGSMLAVSPLFKATNSHKKE